LRQALHAGLERRVVLAPFDRQAEYGGQHFVAFKDGGHVFKAGLLDRALLQPQSSTRHRKNRVVPRVARSRAAPTHRRLCTAFNVGIMNRFPLQGFSRLRPVKCLSTLL
jgi:hypothetical protein